MKNNNYLKDTGHKTPKYVVEFAKDLRKDWTETEEILWEKLRRKNFWVRFRRQQSFWRYIADFYCHKAKFVIELDWEIHNDRKEYDEIREEFLKAYWLKILRFTNKEVINDIESVLNKIKDNLL
jgi:very-short-patch-repair endonuclease